MRYVCLVYGEERILEDIDDAECRAASEALDARGLRVGGEALESVVTATTVRLRHGRVTVTDGPFAETKEQLAGFYLIEADDLNHAIRLAAEIPAARLGSIEVRPVRQLCS